MYQFTPPNRIVFGPINHYTATRKSTHRRAGILFILTQEGPALLPLPLVVIPPALSFEGSATERSAVRRGAGILPASSPFVFGVIPSEARDASSLTSIRRVFPRPNRGVRNDAA